MKDDDDIILKLEEIIMKLDECIVRLRIDNASLGMRLMWMFWW